MPLPKRPTKQAPQEMKTTTRESESYVNEIYGEEGFVEEIEALVSNNDVEESPETAEAPVEASEGDFESESVDSVGNAATQAQDGTGESVEVSADDEAKEADDENDSESSSDDPVEEIGLVDNSENLLSGFSHNDRMNRKVEAVQLEVDAESLDDEDLKKRNEEYTHRFTMPSSRVTDLIKKGVAKAPEPKVHLARFGNIPEQFAVAGNYDEYKFLEDDIKEMVDIIQGQLNDQGYSDRIGMARRERGTDLYNEMSNLVDRLITRSLSSPNGVSVNHAYIPYFTAAVSNEILGFGPIEPFWQSGNISEVMVNGVDEIYVEIAGRIRRATGVRFRDRSHLSHVTTQLLSLSSREVSKKKPYEDAALPDGSRLNALHEDIAPDGPVLTIRRFSDTKFSIQSLVERGSMDEEMAKVIGNLVYHKATIIIAGGTGTGKALDVNTPIPTPDGMKKLKELEEGDTVYGADGLPVAITGYFPQPDGRTCYKLTFSDNSSKVADAEHNWFVNGSVMTTQEIVDSFDEQTFTVPLAKPLQFEEKELTIHPYLFGAWLAMPNRDGLIAGNNPTVDHIIKEKDLGFSKLFNRVGKPPVSYSIDHLVRGLHEFEMIGLEGEYIPEEYFTASEHQRRTLLAGYLDNCGILHSNTGTIEVIIANNENLAKDIIRLISGLGMSVRQEIHESQDSHLFALILDTDQDVFSLTDRLAEHRRVRSESPDYKTIVSVEPVESVEVACISVDNEDHLYLCGYEHTVTHNTSMLNALSGCIPNNERIITVEDTLELSLHENKHVVRLQSRPASSNGEGAVTIRELVKQSLRMRPDRIVVGETRDGSASDMLQAMSTGHEGSLTTVHADDADGTINRLAILTAQAGELGVEQALTVISGAVDLILNIERTKEDGFRRVVGISEVPHRPETKEGHTELQAIPLWTWVMDGVDDSDPAAPKSYGHYEKVNEMSDYLVMKLGLKRRKELSLEEIYELSKLPERKEGE